MKILLVASLFFSLLAFSNNSKLNLKNLDKVRVLYAVDGDTIKVMYQGKKTSVRLIGVDTPESKANKKAKKDAKRSNEDINQIVSLGKKAAAFTKTQIKSHENVYLEYDVSKFDKYKRILAYVYFENSEMLNNVIIKSGYASPMTIQPNVKYQSLFLESYKFAREHKLGLWQ